MEPWAAPKKSFRLMWRCHQFLSGFFAIGHLPRVQRESSLSANDKGGNEMIPRDVHISPAMAEENLS